jgi:5-methylthioadenosine/S-adenosylhomocysteine deaminase
VVELKRPSVNPISNPLSLLVYAASGDDVRDVMIDGKFVVRNKKVLTMDEEEGLKNANKHSNRLLDKTDVRIDPLKII